MQLKYSVSHWIINEYNKLCIDGVYMLYSSVNNNNTITVSLDVMAGYIHAGLSISQIYVGVHFHNVLHAWMAIFLNLTTFIRRKESPV